VAKRRRRHGVIDRSRTTPSPSPNNVTKPAVEKAVEKLAISRAWVLLELRENAERAKKRGQGAVVNRALELIGKEIGIFVDQPQKKIGLDDLSLETLEALLAELEADSEVIAGMAEQSTLALPPPRANGRSRGTA
jgi:hypothetical protein